MPYTAPPAPDLGMPLPPGAVAASADVRSVISAGVNQQTSGQPTLQAIWLPEGKKISSATFVTGSTAPTGLTHAWAALCDSNRNVLAISPSDASGWAANTARTFTFGSPYITPKSGLYYVALLVAGATMPSLNGSTSLGGVFVQATFGVPVLGKSALTGLTNPVAVGSNLGALTTGTTGWYYVYVS